MENARKELGRLMAHKNPHSWAVPDSGAHRYFFLDQDVVSAKDEHGDTPLLRLLALHTTAETVENFFRCCQSQLSASYDHAGHQKTTFLGDQVLRSNKNGVSPLHVAVHRNSFYANDIVSLLLQIDPTLVRRKMTSTGSLPLHVAMANNLTIQNGVLHDLLRADPSAVREEDMNGDNPVSLLYKNVLRFRWAQSWVAYDNPPESMVCDKSWMTVISPDQYLGFSLSMISAAQNGDELSWHDICSFPRCPPLLIKALEMKMSLDTLLLPDHEGCLPLHLSAKSHAISTQSIPQHILEAGASSTLQLVMRLEPKAACFPDRLGKYPLHYALENPTIESHVICELMELSPMEALMTPDCNTGLLPFQLAAIDKQSSLIYSLLRAEPSATQTHCN